MNRIAELAKKQKEIIEYLTRRDKNEWITHLMKIQIFDSDEGLINHWKHEIYALFCDIAKLRGNNKYPSKQFIFDTIWDHYGDRLFTFVDFAQESEPNEKLKSQINFDQVFRNTKNYIEWLAERLSISGHVSSAEVYNKIWALMDV